MAMCSMPVVPKLQSLVAGAGNETLSAALAFGHVSLQGGSGNDQLIGVFGSDTFIGGSGNATMSGASESRHLRLHQWSRRRHRPRARLQ